MQQLLLVLVGGLRPLRLRVLLPRLQALLLRCLLPLVRLQQAG
jgi:hypothetical protein